MTESTAASTRVPVSIQLIGPTVLLDIGGPWLLTDPAPDARGRGVAGDDRPAVIAAGERITL